MDASTPVESRTKESFSMDDLSSVASNVTYQATVDDQSQIDSSANLMTENSQNAIERKESHVTKQESTTYRERSTSGRQDDSSMSPLPADFMPFPESGERGRSRSPRPKVSAEARARWAMLKSLAGVSRDDEIIEEVETDIRMEEKINTSTSNGRDSEAPNPAGLKPLLLGDHSNDNTSMELFLSRLEHDPHIDGRALQEGLQASGLRRGISQRDQQVRDRSRRAHGLESKIQSDTRWIGDRARADADRIFQDGEEGASHGSRLVPGSGHASKADLSMGSHRIEGAIRSGEHDLRHEVQDAWQDIRKREQPIEADLESAVKDGERDLPAIGIRRDNQQSEHDLKSVLIDATRLAENSLTGIDIQNGIQTGERDLEIDLHKLQGESFMSDLQKGEHNLKTGFDHTAEAVGGMLPSVDIGQDIRKGEHELKEALERDGQRIEKMMLGRGLAQDFQSGRHDLVNGVQQGVRLTEKELRRLEGHGLEQGIRKGVQDHLHESGKLANKEIGMLGVHGLGNELKHPSDSIKTAVKDLELSAMIHLQQDGHVLASGVHGVTQSTDQQVDKAKQLAGRDVRMGGAAAREAIRAPKVPKEHSPRPGDLNAGQGAVTRTHGDLAGPPHELSVPQKPTVAHQTPAPHQPTAIHQPLSSHQSSVPQLPNFSHQAQVPHQSAASHQPPALHQPPTSHQPGVPQWSTVPNQAQDAHNPTSPHHDPASHQPNTPQQAPSVRRGPPPPQQPSVQQQSTPHQLSNLYPATPPQQRSSSQQRLTPQQAPIPPKIPNTPQNYSGQQHLATQQSPSLRPPFAPSRPIIQPALAPKSTTPGQSYPPNHNQQLRPSPFPTSSRAPSSGASETSRKPMPASPNSTQTQDQRTQRPDQDNMPGGSQQPSSNDMGLRPDQPPARPNRSLANQQNWGGGSVQSQPRATSTNQPNGNRHSSLPNQPQPQFSHADVEPSPRVPSPNPESIPSIPRPMTGNQRSQRPPGSPDPQGKAGGKGAQRKDAIVADNSEHSKQGDAAHANRWVDVPHGKSRGDEQHGTMAGHKGTPKGQRDIKKGEEEQGEFADPPIEELNPSGSHDIKSPSPHEANIPCQHEGRGSQSYPHQGSSCTNARGTQQTTRCEVDAKQTPSAVAGVQNMLDMFKARSQASIDASAGCPGFIDQMIQLVCNMAQDAMPEIQRRLVQNQGPH